MGPELVVWLEYPKVAAMERGQVGVKVGMRVIDSEQRMDID